MQSTLIYQRAFEERNAEGFSNYCIAGIVNEMMSSDFLTLRLGKIYIRTISIIEKMTKHKNTLSMMINYGTNVPATRLRTSRPVIKELLALTK